MGRIRGVCGGVTLIELIMAMLIAVVLAAMAAPRLQGVGAVRTDTAHRRLIADLRYAQRLALGRQTGVAVQLSTAQERYRVYDAASQINVTDPISGDPGVSGQPWASGFMVDYSTDPQMRGVNLLSTNFGDTVRFDSLGRPADGAGDRFTAQGSIQIVYKGNTRTIFIEAGTGRVWSFSAFPTPPPP